MQILPTLRKHEYMIVVDSALEKFASEGKTIRVGMIGAGFMAGGIAHQLANYSKGIELVAIANRTPDKAIQLFKKVDKSEVLTASSVEEVEANIQKKIAAVVEDGMLLAKANNIDVIIEVTGALEYAAHIVTTAIEHGKHVVMMNAELDGTIGWTLKRMADAKGVVYTLSNGDQPGVEMDLYRYVKGLGLKPLLCGNIKGLHDPYRTPETQKAFAEKWGQNPSMVTSFADGSKISYEQACVANATGMSVAKRGMYGHILDPNTPVEQVVNYYNYDELVAGNGIVDYVVGAEPNGGIFVLATTSDPVEQHFLNLYKVGPGPLYCFYTPYHLCHFDTPSSIARAILFHDAVIAPAGKPTVEVITAAKRDLKAGETLDPIGHFMTYGLCENSNLARKENLLPLGLAENCTLRRDIPKDQVLTLDDVVVPPGRLIDQLWKQQFE